MLGLKVIHVNEGGPGNNMHGFDMTFNEHAAYPRRLEHKKYCQINISLSICSMLIKVLSWFNCVTIQHQLIITQDSRVDAPFTNVDENKFRHG